MKPSDELGVVWGIVNAMVKGGTVPTDPTVAVLRVLELVLEEAAEVDGRVGDRLRDRSAHAERQRENVLAQIREIEEGK